MCTFFPIFHLKHDVNLYFSTSSSGLFQSLIPTTFTDRAPYSILLDGIARLPSCLVSEGVVFSRWYWLDISGHCPMRHIFTKVSILLLCKSSTFLMSSVVYTRFVPVLMSNRITYLMTYFAWLVVYNYVFSKGNSRKCFSKGESCLSLWRMSIKIVPIRLYKLVNISG